MAIDVSPQLASTRHVNAAIHYHKDKPDGSPPDDVYTDRPETFDIPYVAHTVPICDVGREPGQGASYSLDVEGVKFHKHVSVEKDFLNEHDITGRYYAETEQLLKEVTGASRVHIFDHTIRRQPITSPDGQANLGRVAHSRGPVQFAHVDQSYQASAARVRRHLPDDADELLRGRVQIINVWRPIRDILRDPLALALAPSVADEDLVPVGLIYPDKKGETYRVRHSDKHRWIYKSNLTPDEVILIKCYDSKTDGRARRVPHTAFVDPSADPAAPTRQSIELRALVFHPEDRE